MREVAFVTYQQAPELNEHDALAAALLQERGVRVSPAVWDAPDTDWARFDCVVIRSTWDYHLKPDRYSQWLSTLDRSDVRVWNPPRIVLENLNKKYLVDFAARGIEVVPTEYVHAGQGVNLADILHRRGWQEAVIKPAISGSAMGTWRTSRATALAEQDRFTEQLRRQDLLVQLFMSEIAAQGEWSLVYFAGTFSHAVLKRPADGDFRVQREYGGSCAVVEPEPRLMEQARSVLTAVNHPLLYARVDGIDRAGQFLLMELEINEPFLFLGFCPGAAERFANAILQKLSFADQPLGASPQFLPAPTGGNRTPARGGR